MYDKDALQGKTLAELREIGRQFGIKAQMRKQELADKIIELSAQQNVAAVSTESEQSAVEQPQRRRDVLVNRMLWPKRNRLSK